MPKTAHDQLAGLERAAAEAKGRAQDGALRFEAGKAKAEEANERLVAAHRDGKDGREVERAKTAIRKAGQDLQFLEAEAKGLAERAEVAAQAVANFRLTENGRLLSEREPGAVAARDKLVAGLTQLFEDVAAYNQTVSEVSALVSAGGRSPVQDGPDGLGHELEQALRDLRRVIEQREIPVPLPHNRHTNFVEEQNRQAEQHEARERDRIERDAVAT